MHGAGPKPSSSNISADEHDPERPSQSFVYLRPRRNAMLIGLANRL